MKNIIFIFLLGYCFTQIYEDVVILKNGSEVHGTIIEQKPNEYIKIQSGKNIFVYQMDEIDIIKKELITTDNADHKKSNSKDYGENTEKWYTYWALGTTTPSFADDYIDLMEEASTSFSETKLYIDMFSYYRHIKENAILGFIITSVSHTIDGKLYIDGYDYPYNEQYGHNLYSLSYINFPKTFGKGFFYRADIGLVDAYIYSEIDGESINQTLDGGLGFLVGGGYSWDLGGTRILLNTNWTLRNIDSDSQKNLSISLGGLF